MAQPQAPRLVAHRFGRAYGPDSSPRALSRSLQAPIAGVETDCCLTRDGRIVLLHEQLLEEATTLSGWVREHSAAEICRSELLGADGGASGEHPLQLEEGLELLAGRDLVKQFEIKAYADEQLALETVEVVLDLLAAAPPPGGVTEIISFWPECCRRAAARGFATRLIVGCPYTPEALADWAQEASISGVILEGAYFAERPVRVWREAGLSVMSGVVNAVAQLRRVLFFAPDMIATDRPAELFEGIAADAT
jgi:glycerophosphoryl diester phosphodiesterase